MTKGKVLTIVRDMWGRGKVGPNENRALFDSESDTMCCLGFDAIACGLSMDFIVDRESPKDLADRNFTVEQYTGYFKTRCLDWENTADVDHAIMINDDAKLTDEEREERLVPILKRIGGYSEVRFVDKVR